MSSKDTKQGVVQFLNPLNMDLYPKVETKALNLDMLYNANVILEKVLYRKCLLFGVYKHLIYRFYIAAQFIT